VHSARTLRTKRSAKAFALGVLGGVLITSMPSAVNTASKDPVNLESRSRIRRKRRDKPAWRRRWKSSTSKG
jgi:hypothetical protein